VNKLPQKWHDLKTYAVLFYRARAGFVAHVMPIEDDWIGELTVTLELFPHVGFVYKKNLRYYELIVKFETVCSECVYYMSKMLSKEDRSIIRYSSELLDFDKCELCGNLGIGAFSPY